MELTRETVSSKLSMLIKRMVADMEGIFESISMATKPQAVDIKLAEIKERYSLAWKDWCYWPLEDDEGQAKAKDRLDAIGKELNEYKKSKK